MRLAPKLAISFVTHAIVALLGLLAIPFYLKLLGPDGYGLVGFHVVLQSWMFILDLGVTAALSRKLSLYQAGAVPTADVLGLARTAECLFCLTGLMGAMGVIVASEWVASHWLGDSGLAKGEVVRSLQIMALMIALRWVSALYQAALVGLERQNAANLLSVMGAVLRPATAFLAFALIEPSPSLFFSTQAAVVFAELVAFRLLLARSLPAWGSAPASLRMIKGELSFAGGLAMTSLIWLVIYQSDKLVLSHLLPLAEFGEFSIVSAICSGITMLVPPFAQAIQPRLTALQAQHRRPEFLAVYRICMSLMVVLAAAFAGTIGSQPALVIYAWTGDALLAARMASVLSFYAIGTGLAAVLVVPYLLQYALGNIRLHLIGNLAFGAVWIPVVLWAAFQHGSRGTGLAWLIGNLTFLACWVPVVHRRLLSRPERKGLDVSTFWRLTLLTAFLAIPAVVEIAPVGRVAALAALCCIFLGTLAAGVIISSDLRKVVTLWISRQLLSAKEVGR